MGFGEMRKILVAVAILIGVSSCVTTDATHMVELKSGDLINKRIPERNGSAISGSQFITKIGAMNVQSREAAILSEALNGNIPSFLRRFRPVRLSLKRPGKPQVEATIWVMPDYLAVGSDNNFVRVPMNPVTAQKIADRYGCMLPTTKIVDAIYSQADVKLQPKPMQAGSDMVSTTYFWRHNLTIDSQLKSFKAGQLIAGHKKDVVLTNKLRVQPTRVAIYGWHTLNGRPIQPLSLVHGYRYADYSHGIRMISNYMHVDGKAMMLPEILKDPAYAGLLSDEGTLAAPRIRTELLSQADDDKIAL